MFSPAEMAKSQKMVRFIKQQKINYIPFSLPLLRAVLLQ